MDYETADGSQFSLREVLSENGEFQSTLITAFVDGNAYAGRSPQRMEDMDDVDVIQYLEPVPPENVFPKIPEGFTIAPPFDIAEHYLKAPQFTYEDSKPGNTFVADVLLSEATVLERLKQHPHPSIAQYFGAVTKGDRITHLCLKRCYCNLTEYFAVGLSVAERERLLMEIREGIEHLHSLGLAHNDVNPDNVCVDAFGHAILVDFDSCLAFGEPLLKGQTGRVLDDEKRPISARENDLNGLADIEHFLFPPEQDPTEHPEDHDEATPTA
ncbi:hypothetical protein PRZ48_010575 [Zasmidium cellare]|uniref:Protein kinase domain-containing protein n=1 Tax=Zasmidium cellare TaxID=395010 RepID=A0ABR0E9K2_ZASCE|nr:hypothetical protein PRZ48_010575 [Zasmidium cellare]